MVENTRKELTTSAIDIGLTVANFLLNTGFVLQAILLCEECLILLNSGDLTNGNPVAKLFYQLMNNLGKRACSTICNCINIDYFRQLLVLCKDSVGNVQKERLNLALSK